MKVLVFDCRKVLEINCRKLYVFTCFLHSAKFTETSTPSPKTMTYDNSANEEMLVAAEEASQYVRKDE